MIEARAIKKHIRMSPRKMRLVIDLIRGKKADSALTELRFHPKHAAREAEMVLRSALANLHQKASEMGERVKDNEIFVTKAMVDAGSFFKRILPAPKGMANRVRKRSNHLTIIVGTKTDKINNDKTNSKKAQ
jgi:large subunit ribosomal protein L22